MLVTGLSTLSCLDPAENDCLNIALRRVLHNHVNMETERNPKLGLYHTLISKTSWVLYSPQYHRKHYKLQDFESFEALFAYSRSQLFEPGTCRLQATVDTNEPPRLADSAENIKIELHLKKLLLAWLF